jgi:peptide/nickel transport system permease protein
MTQYIVKRILLTIPVLIAVSLISFALIRIVPGDVLDVMYADSPLTDEQIQEIRTQLGMDKPLPIQYWDWMTGVITGNAGNSLWTRRPVLQEIADRLPVTLELALLSFVIKMIIGIPLGVLSAVKQDKPVDQITRLVAIFFLAAPGFWIATLAIVFFASTFGWIPPIGGVAPLFKDPWVNFQQFFLPSVILGASSAATIIRLSRSTLLEVIRQDYVRTAFAKGLTSQRVWWVHAVKNAMIPVVTAAGTQLGGLMGGTVITENIFSLPGVGQLTLSAIHHRDVPQLQLNILFLASVYILLNLVVDISYGWFDPRIRYR